MPRMVSSTGMGNFRFPAGGFGAFADGSQNAPIGNAQLPRLLDVYSNRAPWKVAGVDYAVGIDRSLYPLDANLKDPSSASLPSGVTRDGASKVFTVSGNNVTLDGWDFSLNGGWSVLPNDCSNLTISNCNFKVGSTLNRFVVTGNIGTFVNGLTLKNNVFDGNAIPIVATTASSTASGTVLHLASAAGVIAGMYVANITAPTSISQTLPNGNQTTVISVSSNDVTISTGVLSTVASSSTIYFVQPTASGAVGVALTDRGQTIIRYNHLKNALGEHLQQSCDSSNCLGILAEFNVFENAGFGVNNGIHGDISQVFSNTGSFTGDIVHRFNLYIQNDNRAGAQGLSWFGAGTFGASLLGSAKCVNGTWVMNTTPATSSNAMSWNPTWIRDNCVVQNNYVDTTGLSHINDGTPSWAQISAGTGGGTGSFSAINVDGGNIRMLTGGAMPAIGP